MSDVSIANELKDHFNSSKQRKKGVSVRWLAQNLAISPSMTSMILNGKRLPSLRLLKEMCRLLDIDQETEDRLRIRLLQIKDMGSEDINLSRAQDSPTSDDHLWTLATRKQFVALEDWYYFAIMQTMLLKDYDGTVQFISNFLNLDESTTHTAISKLVKADLVIYDSEKNIYYKNSSTVKFLSRDRDKLKGHHIKNIEKIIDILNNNLSEYNKEHRLVTSACFSCRSQDIPLIKQKIKNLLEEVANTNENEGHDEVCFFLAQMIPLSNR